MDAEKVNNSSLLREIATLWSTVGVSDLSSDYSRDIYDFVKALVERVDVTILDP